MASEFVRVRGWPEGRQSVEMFPVPVGRLKVAVPVFKVKLERFAPEIGMERGLVPGSALMMAASTTPHIWKNKNERAENFQTENFSLCLDNHFYFIKLL